MIQRFFIILFASLILSGCSHSNDGLNEGNLTIGVWYQPITLDPHLATVPVSQQIAAALYTGLVTYDSSGQIVPGVAESWNVSPDGMTYVFRLRATHWSNDDPITADTFVQSLRRLFDQHHSSTALLASIHNGEDVAAGRQSSKNLGIKALADDVLQIQLDRPQPALLAVLASPAGSPIPKVALHKQANWWRVKDNIVVNGVYKVAKWQTDTGLVLEQRDKNQSAFISGFHSIRFVLMHDVQSAIAAFNAGIIHILDANAFNITMLENIPRATRDSLRWEPVWAVTGLAVNQSINTLKDVRVKRALAMAIDRQALIETAFPGQHYQPTASIVPSLLPGYGIPAQPDWSAWDMNQRLSEATRLLQEAGYNTAHPLELKLKLTARDEDQRLAQGLTDQLLNLPIKLTVVKLNALQLYNAITSGDYELARSTPESSIDSPELFLLPFKCDQIHHDHPHYCNHEVDKLLASAQMQSDISARAGDLRQAERLIIDDMVFMPLYSPASRSFVSKKISGYTDSPTGRHMLGSLKTLNGYK